MNVPKVGTGDDGEGISEDGSRQEISDRGGTADWAEPQRLPQGRNGSGRDLGGRRGTA